MGLDPVNNHSTQRKTLSDYSMKDPVGTRVSINSCGATLLDASHAHSLIKNNLKSPFTQHYLPPSHYRPLPVRKETVLLFFLIGLENITIIDRETQAFFINIHLIHGVRHSHNNVNIHTMGIGDCPSFPLKKFLLYIIIKRRQL